MCFTSIQNLTTKTIFETCEMNRLKPIFSNGLDTSQHIRVHVFIMCPTFLLPRYVLVSLIARAIAALSNRLCPSRLSVSRLTPSPLLVIDAETYWFSSRLLLTGYLAVSFTYTVSSAEVSGQWRLINYAAYWISISKNFNSQLTLKVLPASNGEGFKVLLWGLVIVPLLWYFKDWLPTKW